VIVDGGQSKTDRLCCRCVPQHRGADRRGQSPSSTLSTQLAHAVAGHCELGRSPPRERLEECGSELRTHGAVDEEVGGITEQDEQVDEHGRRLTHLSADDFHVQRVLDDHDDEENGQRELHHEEHTHDDHQHRRRYVTVGQTPTLRPSSGSTAGGVGQQLTSTPIGSPHGVDESRVDSHESGARDEMYADHTEPVVCVEISVLVTNNL